MSASSRRLADTSFLFLGYLMSEEVGMGYVWRSIMGEWEGWICYKAMLRNMGINLRGGDFGSIFAIPAKKKEYGAKKIFRYNGLVINIL